MYVSHPLRTGPYTRKCHVEHIVNSGLVYCISIFGSVRYIFSISDSFVQVHVCLLLYLVARVTEGPILLTVIVIKWGRRQFGENFEEYKLSNNRSQVSKKIEN